jgi:iron complex outermembrane receptor protein
VAGVEIEDVTRVSERLTVNFAYSYLFSRGSDELRYGGPNTPANQVGTYNTDPPLPMTPRNKASLLVDYTIPTGPLKGLGFGAGVRYTGVTFGDLAGEWRDPAFTVFDGLAHYNYGHWRLQVNAANLFDKTYVVQCSSYSACYYGLGRDVTASLTRAF